MKLNRLLEHHHASSGPTSLPENLGDGYLLEHNRIFRNMRLGALSAGFDFSAERNVAYQALPLSQLEVILKSKTIPYVDNVAVIDELARGLHGAISWDDVSDGLKRNFVFHESCHAVARNLAIETLPVVTTPQTRALHMLLEESFSNVCELLSITDAQDLVHRIFLTINSYTALNEQRANLSSSMRELGPINVLRFLMMAYLHSNFLHTHLDDRQFEDVLAFSFQEGRSKLNSKAEKTLRALSKIAFTLDLRFRTVTTRFHLRLNGVTLEVEDLLDLDLNQILRGESGYRRFFEALAELALKQ